MIETTAILLAAGNSTRTRSQGADWKSWILVDGKPWIFLQIESLLAATIGEVRVITNLNWEEEKKVSLKNFSANKTSVQLIENQVPDLGPFHSIQLGLANLNKWAWIQPIDAPVLCTLDLQKMWRAAVDSSSLFVQPRYNEKSGHPILISPKLYPGMLYLDPNNPNTRLDFFLKQLPHHHCTRVELSNEQVLQNLNEPKDFLNVRHHKQ
jgi:CTP:molybdopterin cytidylyltransferase MocA